MAVRRGSNSQFLAIAEVTPGVTPATPTMLQLPLTDFTPDITATLIQSDQIRSHPFVDQISSGPVLPSVSFSWELQDDNHDLFFSNFMGANWASNALKLTSNITTMTFEYGDLSANRYDLYTGVFLNHLEINFPAQADGKVTCTATGMALAVSLSNSASAATTVTPANSNKPMVWENATASVDGTLAAVTNLSITADQAADPFYVLGLSGPREYVSGNVTVGGKISIPLETGAVPLAFKMTNGATGALEVDAFDAGTNFRKFFIPNFRVGHMSRKVGGRGALVSEFDITGMYDSVSTTAFSMTRSA